MFVFFSRTTLLSMIKTSLIYEANRVNDKPTYESDFLSMVPVMCGRN